MPIVVQHQPSMYIAGGAANLAGYGEYQKQQAEIARQQANQDAQLAEQKRQFDLGQSFDQERLNQQNEQFHSGQDLNLLQLQLQERARRQGMGMDAARLGVQDRQHEQDLAARFGLQNQAQQFEAMQRDAQNKANQDQADQRWAMQQQEIKQRAQLAEDQRNHAMMLQEQNQIAKVFQLLTPQQQMEVKQQFEGKYGQELFAPPAPPQPEAPPMFEFTLPDGKKGQIPFGPNGMIQHDPLKSVEWKQWEIEQDMKFKRDQIQATQEAEKLKIEQAAEQARLNEQQKLRDELKKLEENRKKFILSTATPAKGDTPGVSVDEATKRFDDVWGDDIKALRNRVNGGGQFNVPDANANMPQGQGKEFGGNPIAWSPDETIEWLTNDPSVTPQEKQDAEQKVSMGYRIGNGQKLIPPPELFVDKEPIPLAAVPELEDHFRRGLPNDLTKQQFAEQGAMLADTNYPFIYHPSQLKHLLFRDRFYFIDPKTGLIKKGIMNQ